ncbi:PTS sugar transporter subunit IIB [Fundicoccus ignavus]|uniref:PTS sugar transporter subunit IIB n=1 Tax=Fundicoccus ignavus TaxID=2664442 RepID=A0A844BXS0_9LACT|nr:PTS sugar transporter subunit IIB [Fundicoccus ignavus]MRJ46808.1 PTS sugar transporter subunit IIB [Fundicoccus ignavus]
MINIMLVCSAGMSTSMLVSAMNDAIRISGIEATVLAKPSTEAMDYLEQATIDVVLIGPHVRFFEETFRVPLAEKNIPMAVINPLDYGRMNGASVLQQAFNLLKG